VTLAQTFLEEVPPDTEPKKNAVAEKKYQDAHKMKRTIDLFEPGELQDLIEV